MIPLSEVVQKMRKAPSIAVHRLINKYTEWVPSWPEAKGRAQFLQTAAVGLLAAVIPPFTPQTPTTFSTSVVNNGSSIASGTSSADGGVRGLGGDIVSENAPALDPILEGLLPEADRGILAQLGGLHASNEWQTLLTKENAAYKDWTGIAFAIDVLGIKRYVGLFGARGDLKLMPDGYTAERNPVTQAAWPKLSFPDGYFGGVQPLNAPDQLPGGVDTVMYRTYWPNSSEHDRPYDMNAYDNTVVFAQGINLRIGNYNSNGAAYALALPDTALHLFIREGEVDGVRLPKSLSPTANVITARTWFAGYVASQAENQLRQHGDFLRAKQVVVRNGPGLQNTSVTILYPGQ